MTAEAANDKYIKMGVFFNIEIEWHYTPSYTFFAVVFVFFASFTIGFLVLFVVKLKLTIKDDTQWESFL